MEDLMFLKSTLGLLVGQLTAGTGWDALRMGRISSCHKMSDSLKLA